MRFAVARFPGSNCDEDCYYVLGEILKQETIYLWHEEKDLKNIDCIVLPGGFSYGDYLRTGAIARFSPIMREVKKFADNGGLVLGICNGFQILLEAGLLEGAMLLNLNQAFICKDAYLRLENNHTPFTNQCKNKQILKLPIAHGDGRFYASRGVLKKLNQNKQIILRYSDTQGEINSFYNPNGSLENIAGICNLRRNVFGLMPHPERASEKILGSTDGLFIFQSILNYILKN